MNVSVKARYADGVFTPLEPLDLDDGIEVIVSVTPVRPASGGGSALLRIIEELDAEHPPGELSPLPVDLAENAKHYLYGGPKA